MQKLKHLVVAVAILSVLAGIYLIMKASSEINAAQGPLKLRIDGQGDVWLLSQNRLHHYDAEGRPIASHDPAALGVTEFIGDFQPLADGEVLLALPDQGAIQRCRFGVGCRDLLAGIDPQVGRPAGAMWLAVDAGRERLFVADTDNHRLLLLDLDGRLLDHTGADHKRFFYPNQLKLEGEGRFLVADTRHRRLSAVNLAGDRFGDADEQTVLEAPMARPGRHLPMASTLAADGKRWVIMMSDGPGGADVLLFDAQGRAERRLELGPDSDPTDLASVAEHMLVVDRGAYRVWQVGLDGEVAGTFGPAELAGELDTAQERAAHWRTVRLAAQVGTGVLPVLGVLLLWLMGERPARVERGALSFDREAAVVGGTHWMPVRPAYQALLRKLTWLAVGLVVPFVVVVGVALTANRETWSEQLRHLLLAGAVVLVAMTVVIALVARRQGSCRLGTDGTHLLFDQGDGLVLRHPIHQVLSDGRHLLMGRRMIPINNRGQAVYEPAAVEALILARLPAAGRVSAVRLFLASLQAGNVVNWSALAMLALVLALQVLEATVGISALLPIPLP